MRLSELSDTMIIPNKKTNSLPIIKTKIEVQLHEWKARTVTTDNVITFKTISVNTARGYGYKDSHNILLRIYKEGKIDIDKEGTSLKIRWTVKLDTLFFLALCPSVILGTIVLLTNNISWIFAIILSLAFFLAFIFLGILLIKYKFYELIYSSVFVNYKS